MPGGQLTRIFQDATNNGSFNEIIGSHSLMSKDTEDSFPFFDDANVLARYRHQYVTVTNCLGARDY